MGITENFKRYLSIVKQDKNVEETRTSETFILALLYFKLDVFKKLKSSSCRLIDGYKSFETRPGVFIVKQLNGLIRKLRLLSTLKMIMNDWPSYRCKNL